MIYDYDNVFEPDFIMSQFFSIARLDLILDAAEYGIEPGVSDIDIKKYVPKKRDRRMIYNKYGFNPTNTPMTLDQIGAQEGITRERVRQIIASNLEKIRKSGKLDIYKDDL